MLLKMAWRNLWRNRTRTLIVLSAIAISYALFLIAIGVSDAMYGELEASAARAAGGAVLVHEKGYWAEQTNDILLEDGMSLRDELEAIPGIDALAPRLLINGLASTASGSAPMRLQGVDPSAERDFSDIADYIDEGTFLAGDEEAPIVLPTAVADDLDAELGDRIVLTATGPDGEMQRALFHLSGTLAVGELGEASGIGYTTLDAARTAMRIDPDALTQIGIWSGRTPEAIAASVRSSLDRDTIEVLTWAEAIPDLVGFIEMDRAFANIYGFLVFIVVVFAITNTFLMIVMERVRELGLLGAVGMTPGRIAWLVILETIVLAAVALTLGFAIGFGVHSLIATYGIDFSSIYGASEIELSGVSLTEMKLTSELRPRRWINSTITVFALVVLSALYPAWRAARLVPAEAMRFYG